MCLCLCWLVRYPHTYFFFFFFFFFLGLTINFRLCLISNHQIFPTFCFLYITLKSPPPQNKESLWQHMILLKQWLKEEWDQFKRNEIASYVFIVEKTQVHVYFFESPTDSNFGVYCQRKWKKRKKEVWLLISFFYIQLWYSVGSGERIEMAAICIVGSESGSFWITS